MEAEATSQEVQTAASVELKLDYESVICTLKTKSLAPERPGKHDLVIGGGDEGSKVISSTSRIPSSPRGDSLEIETEFSSKPATESFRSLYTKTHFTNEEVDELYVSIMNKLDPEDSGENVSINFENFQTFMEPLNLSKYYMMRRVFCVFDSDHDRLITPEQLILGLSTLLRGRLHEQILFAFSVYDEKSQGFLTKSDVMKCLTESSTSTYRHNIDSSRVTDLMELIFPKLDANKDEVISLDEFKFACMKDPTLIECLGTCFPKQCDGHNAHRVGQQAADSNISKNMEYLTKNSNMYKFCIPIIAPEGKSKLKAIDVIKKH